MILVVSVHISVYLFLDVCSCVVFVSICCVCVLTCVFTCVYMCWVAGCLFIIMCWGGERAHALVVWGPDMEVHTFTLSAHVGAVGPGRAWGILCRQGQ